MEKKIKEKERAERDREIAKNLKEKGVDLKIISETTGLSISQIKRIKVDKK